MKRTSAVLTVTIAVTLSFTLGCRKSEEPQSNTSVIALPSTLFLAKAPPDVTSIAALKSLAQEGDTVTIKAVVGGRLQAFVANRAVMTVIDATVDNPCTGKDDHCQTPWDYCCTPPDQLLPQMASVQILGADNRPLAVDLTTIEKLKPLNTLVIQGTVGPRPDEATLVIHTTGIFVAVQQG
ncbi:hypothetical protein ACFL3F_01040 [Planctomycetota bacterium]